VRQNRSKKPPPLSLSRPNRHVDNFNRRHEPSHSLIILLSSPVPSAAAAIWPGYHRLGGKNLSPPRRKGCTGDGRRRPGLDLINPPLSSPQFLAAESQRGQTARARASFPSHLAAPFVRERERRGERLSNCEEPFRRRRCVGEPTSLDRKRKAETRVIHPRRPAPKSSLSSFSLSFASAELKGHHPMATPRHSLVKSSASIKKAPTPLA